MAAFIYQAVIRLYGLAIRLAALFNAKASLWAAGRRRWRSRHRGMLEAKPPGKGPLVWVHCASLGEFEQGRPVIEGIRAALPEVQVLLTFFSPSGYEVRKNYEQASYVAYLPLDTPTAARDFLAIWKPALAVFIKYEFWLFHLQALHRANIPAFLVSALFRPEQLFFSPFGGPFRRAPGWFRHIFVQDEQSAALLRKHGLQNCSAAGDTRVDRVLQIAENAPAFPPVEAFCAEKPVLVAGSTWPEDEALLIPFLNEHLPEGWKAIIAPHQIRPAHIQALEEQLQGVVIRYSQAAGAELREARILLIDNVGMLSALYQYGRLAYIGGGFGAGIHNTLEPIAFGLPVIFGPKYEKFEEARYLVQSGGGFSIRNLRELKAAFDHLQPPVAHQAASEKARHYVLANQGASRQAVEAILMELMGAGG